MEEDKGAAGGSSAAAAPPPSSSSNPPKEAPASSSNPPPLLPASSSNPPKETVAAEADVLGGAEARGDHHRFLEEAPPGVRQGARRAFSASGRGGSGSGHCDPQGPMDLETENRLAALLMEEARRLRVEAEKEGVHAYLCKPNVRGRPNSRFLTATVLGVQQANRVVEVGELWRAREKELELDTKLKSRGENTSSCRDREKYHRQVTSSPGHEEDRSTSTCCSSSKHKREDYSHSDAGLRDEELEEFLHSSVKRGRGDIGSRMDEPGPYLSSALIDLHDEKLLVNPDTRVKEEWERRIIVGPEKPTFIKKSHESLVVVHDTEASQDKSSPRGKKKSKEGRSEKKERREKKKYKHHHHKSRRRGRYDSE